MAHVQLAAFSGALDLLPLTALAAVRTELERAGVAFEHATRFLVAADHANARVLHRSVQAIWKDPARHWERFCAAGVHPCLARASPESTGGSGSPARH